MSTSRQDREIHEFSPFRVNVSERLTKGPPATHPERELGGEFSTGTMGIFHPALTVGLLDSSDFKPSAWVSLPIVGAAFSQNAPCLCVSLGWL
jgi:hypothetical protein